MQFSNFLFFLDGTSLSSLAVEIKGKANILEAISTLPTSCVTNSFIDLGIEDIYRLFDDFRAILSTVKDLIEFKITNNKIKNIFKNKFR